jgi:cytochrome c peroxidase
MGKTEMNVSGVSLASILGAALLLCSLSVRAAGYDEPIRPLPQLKDLKLDEGKVRLGERMFNDVRLSRDNTMACVTCHALDKGGVDGRKSSLGINGQEGPINAPTVYNSGLNFRQFWDGRAGSLEEQAAGPVHNPKEMGSNWPEVMVKLSQDTRVVEQFRGSYKDGLQPRNIQDAIATFERSLLTPSRFDRYLQGDARAITTEEAAGYQRFKSYGCVACHQGVNVGGNMFQMFGVMGDYFQKRGNATEADLGRYNVTKRESDRHVFKVPSLRNVALTAPYFHDGSAATLGDAVDVMFKYQLGRPAPDEDKRLIIKFLMTLSGESFEAKQLGALR